MIPNPYKDNGLSKERYLSGNRETERHFIWQEGFDALKVWLFEPCTEHPIDEYEAGKPMPMQAQVVWTAKSISWLHRYLCPECMKELEENQ